MAIKVEVTGTIAELSEMWTQHELAEMLLIDLYKIGQVPPTNEYTITTTILHQVGKLSDLAAGRTSVCRPS